MTPEDVHGNVAVLDVGKTTLKVSLADAAGRAIEQHRTASPTASGPLYPSLDSEATWEWIQDRLRDLARNHRIDFVVPVTHGATVALLAGDRLALPVLDYEHVAVELESPDYPAPSFSETGSPPLPAGLNLGRQLFWQEKHFPADMAAVTTILTYPQYFAWRLCGEPAAEVTSLGCHTDLWCPTREEFSSLARTRGWAQKFPALRPAWTQLGPVREDLRARTGLAPHCSVLCGIHDSNAGYFLHRSGRSEPFCVVSTGTWVVCMAAGASLDRLDPCADTLANVDAWGRPVATARFMGGREYAVLAGPEGLECQLEARDLLPLLSSNTRALPAFAAEGGPYRDRAGRIRGPVPVDARARAALAVLYSALMTDDCLDRIGARGPCILEGRWAENAVYAEILAALRRPDPVWVAQEGTGTLAGAVRLVQGQGSQGGVPLLHQASPLAPEAVDPYRARWRQEVDGREVDGNVERMTDRD